MYGRVVDCRELKPGMRVAREVVHRDMVLAKKGTVLTDCLIHLFLFLGVKRVGTEAPESGDRGSGRATAAR